MIIPNDTGGNWRAEKFIQYAEFVPPVHQSFLIEYAKRRNLNEEECIFLSFIMGNVYSELTAIFMFENWNKLCPNKQDIDSFLKRWNDKIVYGSARKWLRYCNRAWTTFNWFSDETKQTPLVWFNNIAIGNNEREVYDNIKTEVMKCPEYGRFASDLFNEILMIFSKSNFIQVKLKSDESINFYEGDNLTSGLFNIMYMDERADEYDKTRKLTSAEFDMLLKKLLELKDMYKTMYNKEVDVPLFVTKICSFRNCFKGKRGGGYHHYRQLKYLKIFETIAPEWQPLWDECYDIRKTVYPEILRGEDHGIFDIPPELTKWWLKRGWIGNESEALASIKRSTLENFYQLGVV
jgi:hypothetical protein